VGGGEGKRKKEGFEVSLRGKAIEKENNMYFIPKKPQCNLAFWGEKQETRKDGGRGDLVDERAEKDSEGGPVVLGF